MDLRETLVTSGLPAADGELLLAYILGKDRSWILAHSEEKLSNDSSVLWKEMRDRAKNGEPISYIVGWKEFYGRRFTVDSHVLIPRPATEGLLNFTMECITLPLRPLSYVPVDTDIIAIGMRWGEMKKTLIVDAGTGSGCIAATLATLLPESSLLAIDQSEEALEIARLNIELHKLSDRIKTVHADACSVIQNISEPFFVVSNPPYVRTRDAMKGNLQYEPLEALDGGTDGADVIRKLVDAINANAACVGFAFECRSDHEPIIRKTLTRPDVLPT
jgi:release factor glutamine methyltransferase